MMPLTQQPSTTALQGCTFRNRHPAFLIEERERLQRLFDETGVLFFPGLLREDPLFLAYVEDLTELARTLLIGCAQEPDPDAGLAETVTRLAKADRKLAGTIYDIGTRPAKLLSGMLLKCHPAFVAFCRAVFGEGAIIATPSLSDTLHVFPPGEDSFRFNLPIHQDYPYLLQSPAQITFWVNFLPPAPNVGGISVWVGSHRLGICPTRKNEMGHLEVCLTDGTMDVMPSADLTCDVGDVVIMHSLLLHRSNHNLTADQTRIVQLFRYSDLRDSQSRAIHWASAEHGGRGASFAVCHPDKFLG
jgi:hypothetical protein